MTYIFVLVQLVQLALLVLVYWSFKRRISRIEMSVVRQIMEESPELPTRVLATFDKLRSGQIDPDKALKEARRLHGLDP